LAAHFQDLAKISNHVRSDVGRETERRIPTRSVPGASFSTASTPRISIVWTRTVAGIASDTLADHLILQRRQGNVAVECLRKPVIEYRSQCCYDARPTYNACPGVHPGSPQASCRITTSYAELTILRQYFSVLIGGGLHGYSSFYRSVGFRRWSFWLAHQRTDKTSPLVADSDEVAPLFRNDCAPGFRDDAAPLG
jgi:hypothetical protein